MQVYSPRTLAGNIQVVNQQTKCAIRQKKSREKDVLYPLQGWNGVWFVFLLDHFSVR